MSRTKHVAQFLSMSLSTLILMVVGVMAACATPGAPGRSLGLRGGGGPGLQALAVAVQAEAARIKREAGLVKDSGDAWMKAWMQSCANVLAEERCAAAARTGTAVDALQMRAETLAAMQANYKRFKARLKADKGDSKVVLRRSFLHVPAGPVTFGPLRAAAECPRTGRSLAHVRTAGPSLRAESVGAARTRGRAAMPCAPARRPSQARATGCKARRALNPKPQTLNRGAGCKARRRESRRLVGARGAAWQLALARTAQCQR
jgi:hypothetical protein